MQTVFELARGPHHDYIVCVRCGRAEERQRVIAKKIGFNLSDHALTLYGECSETGCHGQDGKK